MSTTEIAAMRVLGISGSLRRESYNTALLRHAGALLNEEGVDFAIYDGLRDLPLYDQDSELVADPPDAVAAIRAAVAAVDAVFIATPEYNSSLPGVLKNALDWLSRPRTAHVMRNKPVVVIGASTAMFGAVWAQAEARKVLGAMGARVIEAEFPLGYAAERFDEGGRLTDETLEAQVREVALMLVADARVTGAGIVVDGGTNVW